MSVLLVQFQLFYSSNNCLQTFYSPSLSTYILHIFTIMQYVFVYGTLKKGQPNHHLLENEENGKKIFCGKALSKKKFPLIVACRYNIPYVLDAAGQGKVIEGEIYKYVSQNQNCNNILFVLEDFLSFLPQKNIFFCQ